MGASKASIRHSDTRWRVLWIAAVVLAVAGVWAARQSSSPTNEVALDPIAIALSKGKPTIVEFGANACAACKEMKPVLAALVRNHGDDIEVVDVDVLKRREYLSAYRIQLMPTQIFFDAKGREIGRNLGAATTAEILAQLGVSSLAGTP